MKGVIRFLLSTTLFSKWIEYMNFSIIIGFFGNESVSKSSAFPIGYVFSVDLVTLSVYSIGNGERRNGSHMQSDRQKTRIVEQFIKDFNQKGHKVTLDAISKEIHVSKKTIYKYFPTKTDIYLYILYNAREEVKQKQKEIYDDASLSTKEKLKRILSIRTAKEKQIDLSKLSSLSESEPVFYRELMKSYESQWLYFKELILKAKEEGIMDEKTDAGLLILVLSSSYEALYRNDFMKKNKVSYSDAVDSIGDIVLDGCLRKETQDEK